MYQKIYFDLHIKTIMTFKISPTEGNLNIKVISSKPHNYGPCRDLNPRHRSRQTSLLTTTLKYHTKTAGVNHHSWSLQALQDTCITP